MSFQERYVLFDYVPEFPEILVQWIVPKILTKSILFQSDVQLQRKVKTITFPVVLAMSPANLTET